MMLGTAGGQVTAKKENRSKRLQLTILESEAVRDFVAENREKIAGLYSCFLEGHEYRSLQRLNLENLADAVTKESGQKVLAITIKDSDFSDNYNGYTYLDTMKESAVMNYLEETHDRYEKRTFQGEPFLYEGEFYR